MTINKIKTFLFVLSLVAAVASCKKGWLDEKPKESLSTLDNLRILQGLLNNTQVFNTAHPAMGETSANDYFLKLNDYNSRTQLLKNTYSWAAGTDFYAGRTNVDWTGPYQQIYITNTVLDEIAKIQSETLAEDWLSVKGTAFFFRANSYYNLSQIFCKAYDNATSSSDLGLVLRTTSDISSPMSRSSIEQTYALILDDLNQALGLLKSTSSVKTQPGKAAALALLARVYLSMREYEKARDFANQALNITASLIDYNTLNLNQEIPFPLYPDNNPEIIFMSYMNVPNVISYYDGRGSVDTVLLSSYAANDLRRNVFFDPNADKTIFVGNYGGDPFTLFNGLATDELYLIRAEGYARKNDVTKAMNDVNTLLEKRWDKNAVFVPITAANQIEAISKIILERRKELCFRGIRWTDLRRLNLEPAFAQTLHRGLLGEPTLFELPANDARYVLPIPDSEILISKIAQNPR